MTAQVLHVLIAEPRPAYLSRPPLVVDCSVLSALLFEEPARDEALRCLSGKTLHAPSLLDHEIVYSLLRDANPDYVHALLAPDVMTIPANTESGSETRAAQSGPVFSVDPITGSLHMRYTARTRSIEWKQDTITGQAVDFLQTLLAAGSPYRFTHRLEAGQGLLCNNVLHNRTGFTDDVDKGMRRLLYRARYFDRIAHTHLNEIFDLGTDR